MKIKTFGKYIFLFNNKLLKSILNPSSLFQHDITI